MNRFQSTLLLVIATLFAVVVYRGSRSTSNQTAPQSLLSDVPAAVATSTRFESRASAPSISHEGISKLESKYTPSLASTLAPAPMGRAVAQSADATRRRPAVPAAAGPCLTTMTFNRLAPFSGRADTITATVVAHGSPTYTASQAVAAGQIAVVFAGVPCPVMENNPVSVTLEGTGWRDNQMLVSTTVEFGGMR